MGGEWRGFRGAPPVGGEWRGVHSAAQVGGEWRGVMVQHQWVVSGGVFIVQHK